MGPRYTTERRERKVKWLLPPTSFIYMFTHPCQDSIAKFPAEIVLPATE